MKLHVRILLILSLFVLPYTVLAAAGSVQVTVDKLNVRSGPSLNDPVMTTVTKNTVLPVLSEQPNWVKVKLPNGQEGWLASWMVKSIPTAAAQKKITSKVTNLNIRSGPSQTFPVVANINPGQAYPVLQKSGEWVQIQLSGDKKGWAAGWLVAESGGTATTPAKAPVTAPTTPSQAPTQTPATSPVLVTQQGGTVTVNHSPYIYPEPNSSLTAIGQLSPGMTVKQLSEQSGWIKIDIDGVIGWISKTEKAPPPLTVTPQSPSQTAPPTTSPSANDGIGKATVTSSMVNLRSQPTTDSELISTLAQGTSLTLLEQQGDWYRVKTSEGNEGWVAGWLINVEQAAIPAEAFVTILNPDTNVRSGPGTTYDIVGRVQAGERYAIVKKEEDWFRIKLKDGSTGYIAGWLVSADGTENVVKGNELVDKVIVVDAGHGGDDNGATGSSFSTLEKTINLQVALLLKNKLEAAGAKVIMTRSDDRKLTLQDRVDVAVNNNADIFVSIHHNTHPNSLTNGTIVFYYNQGKSSQLASLVQSEIVRSTTYKDLNARYGNYFVLRENPVVSILAEIGFLSNYQEELRLRSSKQQELAADGLYKGILRYFAAQ
ncbi:MAG TPA: SH3 domain-containing protein [Candidatus Bathyarchaeia archaeon]|nr:SH3 domain-containing protein [Candidatus Bathyarchaeia archaeon]